MKINTMLRFTETLTDLLRPASWLMTAALATSLAASALAQAPVVKSGDSIAFMGDSITQGGWENPVGYVRLVMSALDSNDIKATAVPAGISGHKSNDMLARLRRDVLDKKPTWMTLSCGVNDVWHGANGVPLPQYKTNITAIIDQAQAAGIKVMVLTATVIGEDDNANNQKLVAYNDFLRALAKEKGCLLADLNADMWTGLKASSGKGGVFTADGVHMNAQGNCLMATGVLRAFGLTEAQLLKAKEGWMSIPNAMHLQGQQGLSMGQYEQLKALAERRNCSVADLVNKAFAGTINGLLKTAAQ
ncbi:MAG: GDSL-type esterase/lipase family protein [Verrucomicrobia bacterium]|nr:GDSL-type esterase/lipase family protein [Verrucomicrobiota bacterium]